MICFNIVLMVILSILSSDGASSSLYAYNISATVFNSARKSFDSDMDQWQMALHSCSLVMTLSINSMWRQCNSMILVWDPIVRYFFRVVCPTFLSRYSSLASDAALSASFLRSYAASHLDSFSLRSFSDMDLIFSAFCSSSAANTAFCIFTSSLLELSSVFPFDKSSPIPSIEPSTAPIAVSSCLKAKTIFLSCWARGSTIKVPMAST